MQFPTQLELQLPSHRPEQDEEHPPQPMAHAPEHDEEQCPVHLLLQLPWQFDGTDEVEPPKHLFAHVDEHDEEQDI